MDLERRLHRYYRREVKPLRRRAFVLVDMIGYAAAAAIIAAAFVFPTKVSPLAAGYTQLLERPEVRSAMESGFSYYKQTIQQKNGGTL